jgi:hypothetical protein
MIEILNPPGRVLKLIYLQNLKIIILGAGAFVAQCYRWDLHIRQF